MTATATSPGAVDATPALRPSQAPRQAATSPDPRRAALVAGWGYVALFLLAIFANFAVVEPMVVVDDPSATLTNIAGSLTTFRLGLVAFLAVFVIDVPVAWALHLLFRGHDHDRSLLAAWCRLVYTAFLGVGLIFLFQVLHLVEGLDAAGGGAFDRGQVAAQVAAAVDAFDAAWLIGLVLFGVHLVLIGSLVLTSRVAPRALGLVLIMAGLAYVVDTVCRAVLPDYEAVAQALLAIVAIPSVLGEGWLGLWLLLRAGRPPVAARAPSALLGR